MQPKPKPSEHLQMILSDFRARYDRLILRINKAEAEGKITKEAAAELRARLT